MKQKLALMVGGLVSGVALYLVFRDVRFDELTQALRSFESVWLIPSLVLFYWSMYLRGARWAWFFERPNSLNGRRLFAPLMIGFAFNCILPGRVGEPVRAFSVSRREKIGFPSALATILTERIFDAATLLAFLAISLSLLPKIDPSVEIEFWGYEVKGSMLADLLGNMIRLSAVLVLGVIVFMIPWVQRLCIAIPYKIPILPPRFQDMLSKFVQDLSRGFTAIRNPVNLVVIVGYSIAIWGLAVASTQVLAYGFEGMDMSFLEAMAVVSLAAVFILIPAAPGYWGLFEAGVLFTLTVFAVQPNESVGTAYALTLHLVQYIPILLIGLVLAAQSQIRLAQPLPADEEAG
jgi:glycosyltransferase 2 family protein